MDADLQQLLSFLEQQKSRRAAHFPTIDAELVLSFMGTTSMAGSHAAVAVCPVVGLDARAGSREMFVRLRGSLPRLPNRGECITVHVTNLAQFQGYQIKTRSLAGDASLHDLYETKDGELLIKGSQTFTVHHSPYTMKFFEQIPFEEVQQVARGVRFALLAVGDQANISPRFVFHFEERLGRLVLYHGDGLALKTYMNLRSNRQETRVIVDLDDFTGYALRGTVEEFQPHQHPEAYDRICHGFTAGNWGKPSRTFRFTADTWARIEPARSGVQPKTGG